MKNFYLGLLFLSGLVFGEVVDQVAATVNGEIILYSEIKDFQRDFPQLQQLDQRLAQVDPAKVKDDRFVLELLIEDKLIKQFIDQNAWQATEGDVQKEIEQRTRELGITQNELSNLLKEQGSSFEQYKKTIQKSIERQTLFGREISTRVSVSDADIETYLREKTGTDISSKFDFDLEYLTFKYNKQNADKLIGEIKKDVDNKITIKSLKDKYKLFKPSLTDIGIIQDDNLDKVFRAEIHKTPVGTLSQPIFHRNMIYVFHIKGKSSKGKYVSSKEMEDVKNILFQREFVKQLNFWVLRQKSKSLITTNI